MLFRSDRKSTRLNSSHTIISYAVFCLKKKKKNQHRERVTTLHPPADHAPPHPRAHSVDFISSSLHLLCVVSLFLFFFFFLMIGRPPRSTLFPYTPLFR